MRGCMRSSHSGALIMLDLVWRPRAHLDRESIAIFLGVERRNPEEAINAMKRIGEALDLICRFPDTGGHFHMDGLDHEYRTMLANPYTIYYRYNEHELTIYRILHQHQDIDTYTLIELAD